MFFPRKPLIQLLDEMAGYGLEALELVYDIPHIDQFNDDLVAHIKKLSKEGMRFSLHSPFLEVNLSGHFEEVRSFSRRLTEEAIQFAGRAGCDPVVIHPGYTFMLNKVDSIEKVARLRMIEALIPLTQYAKDKGITLGLENLQMPFFLLHGLKDFVAFKQAVPELGLVFDLGHLYIMKRRAHAADPEGEICEELRAIGINNVIHMHVSNNKGIGDDHGFIHGDIDLKRVIQWLHDEGYRGRAIIESTEMERLGVPAVLEKIKEIQPK